jgi:hypothetical protein
MNLNAKSNLFKLVFPIGFFPDKIVKKYEKYLQKSQIPYNNFYDFMNSTVQSVTIPTLDGEIVEQKGAYRVAQKWRSGFEAIRSIERSFTVEFKLVESFMNYFALMECFLDFYSFQNKYEYLGNISIEVYDTDLLSTIKIKYGDVLYKGLSTAITFNHGDVRNQFKTFSVSFAYNNLDIDFDFIED